MGNYKELRSDYKELRSIHDYIAPEEFAVIHTKLIIESLRARFIARQRLTLAAADCALVSIARGFRWHVIFNGPGGRSFMADRLAEALAEADAWLDHDDLAEQWATLGCDREGRVIEPNWASPL